MKNFGSKWNREDLIKHLPEFASLYNQRPIKDNNGGMKSAHMFPAWFVVKMLQPKFLIESGVWKGLGTWFFQQASPSTQIISIDPEPGFRIYTGDNVTYLTQDFLEIDWSIIDIENCLVFFDDHQNCMPRLKKCKEFGFKKIMVEDNYPPQQGDCYTPKKILSGENFIIDYNGYKTWHRHNTNDLQFFVDNISTYQEMPPIFKDDKTRWGDAWNDSYPTPPPLLDMADKEIYQEFFDERFDYTWICYIEMP